MIKKQFLKSKQVCKVTFSLPAAVKAQSAFLVGDFNNWDEQATPMQRKSDGRFEVTLDLEKELVYAFRYFVNGNEWHNDWLADGYVPNAFSGDNSLVDTREEGHAPGEAKDVYLPPAPSKPLIHTVAPTTQDIVSESLPLPPEPIKPAAKKQVFVSYSSKDRPFVVSFISRLQSDKVSFWLDVERIELGAPFWFREIQKGLETSQALLLIASPNSMASDEVAKEWYFFVKNRLPILILMYQPTPLSYQLDAIQRLEYVAEHEAEIRQRIIKVFE